MAKIYDIKTKQRRKVSRMEFFDLLDTTERYVNHLRVLHPDRMNLNKAIDIIAEMKFNGLFNPKFRDSNVQPLEELLDFLYMKIHTE
jgi:hypothetical protein